MQGKSSETKREGVSVIVPVFNKLEVTQKCIDHLRAHNAGDAFELIIIDNGSTDNTQDVLSKKSDIVYIRNEENLGLSKAYNRAGKAAHYDTFFFMHNDVFINEKDWIAKIRGFILSHPEAGVVGLYGAKTLRKDGGFRGKTIVHSLREQPSIKRPFERVAVIDGMFMALRASVFKEIGGFNEAFPIHFYDKDISLRARKQGFVNYVLNVPCEHQCASTRSQIKNDTQIRDEAERKFVEMWAEALPASEETVLERIAHIWKRSAS